MLHSETTVWEIKSRKRLTAKSTISTFKPNYCKGIAMFKPLNAALVSMAILGVFSSQVQSQGLTTGTYVANFGQGCATLVLAGAGPDGNEYRYDEGCNGSADYFARSVKVTAQGLRIDRARMSNIATNANGFTGDFSLQGTSTRGVMFTRQ